jgi:hypothetical protein
MPLTLSKPPRDPADDFFVARYVRFSRHFAPELPTLGSSLAVFAGMEETRDILVALGRDVSCLIQGYTAPQNAKALRLFLSKAGIGLKDIFAVDLLDLPGIYQRLGVRMPQLRFFRGDACDISAWAPPGGFDIVIQDFTLNCLPPILAPRLMREARRVLRPDGLAMVSFTDSSGLRPRFCAQEAFRRHGVAWSPRMTSLAEAARDPTHWQELAADLMGATLAEEGERVIFVSPPAGRFEFFQLVSNTLDAFGKAGFQLAGLRRAVGVDPAGLTCVRHRCLLRPIPAAR